MEVKKSDIIIKTNQPPKEILSNNPLVGKDIKSPESKSIAPVVKKPDIEIKENKPPKEESGNNIFVERDVKADQFLSQIFPKLNQKSLSLLNQKMR